MKRAAGVIVRTADDRVLLLRRAGHDHPGEWAFPGGGIEEGESTEDAARRELREETGIATDKPLPIVARRIKDDVDFTTHLLHVDTEVKPVLNHEHDVWQWVDRHHALDTFHLHPGAKTALLRPDMNELDVAKALKAGELASPQRYSNMMLACLRVTGTGAAYRNKLDEYVWRDPSIYLNDDFVERCAGLPVVLEHPPGLQLTSEEFRERNIGSIMLPYIEGDEVWGVARIYDEPAMHMIENEKLSTSPGVVFRKADVGSKYDLVNGSTLLIEGTPSLLDHLAVCEAGVWDKGGEAAGISQENTAMAEKAENEGKEERQDAEGAKPPADSKDGDKLDQVLAHLDSLHKRMDAYEAKKDDDEDEEEEEEKADRKDKKSRKDSRRRKDAKEEDEEEVKDDDDDDDEEEKPRRKDSRRRKDAADCKMDDDDARSGRRDGESQPEPEKKSEEALAKEREGNDLKKNDSRMDSLEKTLSELAKRIPTEMPEADRSAMISAQSKAERVAQAFGDSAPRFVTGETLVQYRRRLADMFKKHSPKYRETDLARLDEQFLGIAEETIYADAWDAAIRPANEGVGNLVMVADAPDESGRRIRRFYGDAAATWAPFIRYDMAKRVTGIKTKFN